MQEFFIPTKFEDSGKLMGIFRIRNVVEAGILALPFVYIIFKLTAMSLTNKILVSSVFAVPVGGFALMGINDDTFTLFLKTWWRWLRNRKIIEYRGDAK